MTGTWRVKLRISSPLKGEGAIYGPIIFKRSPSAVSHKSFYNPFVVSMSNHERNSSISFPLRQAQGERDM